MFSRFQCPMKTTCLSLFAFGLFWNFWNWRLLQTQTHRLQNVQTLVADIYQHLKTIQQLKLIKTKPVIVSTQSNTDPTENEYIHVKYYDELKCNLFSGMTATDLCYDKPIVKLHEHMSIHESLCNLHDSNRTSALVMSENNYCMGVVDTPDVIRYVLTPQSMNESMKRMLRRCVIADSYASVNDIIVHLRNGMRYIAITGETITGEDDIQMVSQGAIVRIIVSNTSSFISDIMETSIKTLQLGQRIPMHISNTDIAKNAFATMVAYGITSLPVLNGDGIAQGVISASDIFYARNSAEHLELPVLTYVAASRKEANISRDANCIVSCRTEDSLGTILRIMLHENIHHVYVLEDGKPTGVISFVDILRIL